MNLNAVKAFIRSGGKQFPEYTKIIDGYGMIKFEDHEYQCVTNGISAVFYYECDERLKRNHRFPKKGMKKFLNGINDCQYEGFVNGRDLKELKEEYLENGIVNKNTQTIPISFRNINKKRDTIRVDLNINEIKRLLILMKSPRGLRFITEGEEKPLYAENDDGDICMTLPVKTFK